MTPTDTLPFRVAELLSSRLCHDLISPVAALSNGLELLGDGDGGMDSEIASLLAFSVRQAAGRLICYRTAYGFGGETVDAMTLSEVSALIRGIAEEDKIALNLPEDDRAPGRNAVKILLNTALMGLECLPNRGQLSVEFSDGDGTRMVITASGEGTRLRSEVAEALDPAVDIEHLTARSVQGYLSMWLASAAGAELTVDVSEPSRVSFTVSLPG
jgi:histidine phosphotransferase ChpT